MGHGLPLELVGDLVDPETHEPLREATPEEMGRLRDAVERGVARRRDGGEVPSSFDGAFLSADGKAAYLVVEGVPNFLVEERIEVDMPVGTA